MENQVDTKTQGIAVYNIREFGARGNSHDKDTAAIQKAIDACAKAGGGMVYCPPGTYLSGTIFLKSNMQLHLEAGATLLGSPDQADYSRMFQTNTWVGKCNYDEHLISARRCCNITITGQGTIDGNGRAFFGSKVPGKHYLNVPGWRPGQMLTFSECRNVTLRDVQLIDAPHWSVWPQGCDGVQIQGVKIVNNREGMNCDGITMSCCRDVRISDCYIDAGDDCIAIYSFSYFMDDVRPCENVVVTNCVLSTPCNGLRLGVYSDWPIRNCVFSNIVMFNTRTGINLGCSTATSWRIEHERVTEHGPMTENISFQNIVMDTEQPLRLWIDDCARAPAGLRHVSISDVRATASQGCYIGSHQHLPIEDVRIQNMQLTLRGQMPDPADTTVPYPFPEYGTYTLPHGFYCRHVRNLEFHRVGIDWEDARGEWLSAIRAENVQDLMLNGVTAGSAPGRSAPAIHLTNVDGAFVQGCRATPGTGTFLATDGLHSAHIQAAANDLGRAAKGMQIMQ